jgi:hypothetical protein
LGVATQPATCHKNVEDPNQQETRPEPSIQLANGVHVSEKFHWCDSCGLSRIKEKGAAASKVSAWHSSFWCSLCGAQGQKKRLILNFWCVQNQHIEYFIMSLLQVNLQCVLEPSPAPSSAQNARSARAQH